MAEREYPSTSEAWQTTQRLAPVTSVACCREGVWAWCLAVGSLEDCPCPKETLARTNRVTKSHEQAFFLALMRTPRNHFGLCIVHTAASKFPRQRET